MGLYKGRYLIAVYDKNDNFIDCATSLSELKFIQRQSVYSQISHKQFFGERKFVNVYLIDCLEKHNDCFKEEDEIFLREFGRNPETIAKNLGISRRTYYRWLQKGKIKLEPEMEGEKNVI